MYYVFDDLMNIYFLFFFYFNSFIFFLFLSFSFLSFIFFHFLSFISLYIINTQHRFLYIIHNLF